MKKSELLKMLENFGNDTEILIGQLSENSVWIFNSPTKVDLENIYFSFYQHGYVVDIEHKYASKPAILIS